MSLSGTVLKNLELQNDIYPKWLRGMGELHDLENKFLATVRMAAAIPPKHVSEYISVMAKVEELINAVSLPDPIVRTLEKRPLLAFDYSFDHLFEKNEIDTPVVLNETKKAKKIILDIFEDNNTLFTIEPRQFEEIIAELLFNQGYEVELTKQTRDNGYDIIALKRLGYGHHPLKLLVECKRFTNKKVTIDVVRSFREVIVSEQANRGIIATTSYFTRDAIRKKEQHPYLLDCKDKDDIIRWIGTYAKGQSVILRAGEHIGE